MAAGVHNFAVDQGAYWSAALLWKDEADVPIDLTGYTARMQVRETLESDTVLVELTTANGRITLAEVEDPPGTVVSNILLELPAVTTAAFDIDHLKATWRYDLEMVPANSEVVRLLKGKFVVSPEVTR